MISCVSSRWNTPWSSSASSTWRWKGPLVNQHYFSMSNGIASTYEKPRVEEDDAALILTSGPVEESNHQFADWFKQLRYEGWEAFEKAPMPDRREEAWRFANIKAIDFSRAARPRPVAVSERAGLISRSAGLGEIAGKMVFAND